MSRIFTPFLLIFAAIMLVGWAALADDSSIAAQMNSFRADTARLNAQLDENQGAVAALDGERRGWAADLAATVARITARLQAGTTPANPDLVAEWQHAAADLAGLDQVQIKLSQLSARLANTEALASYLATAVHGAYALPGATDADHNEFVRIEGIATNASDLLKRLNAEVTNALNQQADSLDVQHRNLLMLRHAVDIGALLGNNVSTMRGGAE